MLLIVDAQVNQFERPMAVHDGRDTEQAEDQHGEMREDAMIAEERRAEARKLDAEQIPPRRRVRRIIRVVGDHAGKRCGC